MATYKNITQYKRAMMAKKAEERRISEELKKIEVAQKRDERYLSKASEREMRRDIVLKNNLKSIEDYENSMKEQYGEDIFEKMSIVREIYKYEKWMKKNFPNFKSVFGPTAISVIENATFCSLEVIRQNWTNALDSYSRLMDGRNVEITISDPCSGIVNVCLESSDIRWDIDGNPVSIKKVA